MTVRIKLPPPPVPTGLYIVGRHTGDQNIIRIL